MKKKVNTSKLTNKLLPSKKLTDEDILFLAAEGKPAKIDSKKSKSQDAPAPQKRGRKKATDKVEVKIETPTNVEKSEPVTTKDIKIDNKIDDTKVIKKRGRPKKNSAATPKKIQELPKAAETKQAAVEINQAAKPVEIASENKSERFDRKPNAKNNRFAKKKLQTLEVEPKKIEELPKAVETQQAAVEIKQAPKPVEIASENRTERFEKKPNAKNNRFAKKKLQAPVVEPKKIEDIPKVADTQQAAVEIKQAPTPVEIASENRTERFDKKPNAKNNRFAKKKLQAPVVEPKKIEDIPKVADTQQVAVEIKKAPKPVEIASENRTERFDKKPNAKNNRFAKKKLQAPALEPKKIEDIPKVADNQQAAVEIKQAPKPVEIASENRTERFDKKPNANNNRFAKKKLQAPEAAKDIPTVGTKTVEEFPKANLEQNATEQPKKESKSAKIRRKKREKKAALAGASISKGETLPERNEDVVEKPIAVELAKDTVQNEQIADEPKKESKSAKMRRKKREKKAALANPIVETKVEVLQDKAVTVKPIAKQQIKAEKEPELPIAAVESEEKPIDKKADAKKSKKNKPKKETAAKPEEEPKAKVVTIKDFDSTEIKIVTNINGNDTIEKIRPESKKQLLIEPLTDIYRIPKSKALTIDNRKDEFINSFLGEIEKFLVNEMYVDRTSKIVVAVSGGVDSIAMLDVMAQLADKYQFTLFVAHYNHNLRGSASQSDMDFVKKVAESYNLPFYTSGGKVKQFAEKNGISIEAAARFLRYSFLERTSRNLSADFVATAHTADDSAETFLINLLRGSGLTGLSGIPYRRQFIKDVLLIRPFINIKKSTLIKYAKVRRISWHEDETNILQNYTRNKIRLDLLPKLASEYNPAIIDVINRTAKLLQGADRIIHSYVRNNLPNIITDIQTDRFSIKLQLFQTFDKFVQGEMLQSALMKYFRMQTPSMNTIDRIIDLQDSEIGAKCEISKTVTAIKDRNTIVLIRNQYFNDINTIIDSVGKFKIANFNIILKEVNQNQVEISKNPNIEYFDLDKIPPALFVRNWKEGDSFQPIGMMGNMKIADFLTNEKVPFVDRQNVLLLSTKNDIIWVIGKRISEKFKIKPETKRFLKIEIRNSEK